MAPALGRGGLGEEPDLAVIAVEAVDLQVFAGDVLLAPEVDGHVGFALDPGDLAALAVVQIGGDGRADADIDAADVVTMAGQREQAHDVDRHALDRLDDPGAAAVEAVLVYRPFQAGADPLAGHLDQAEGAHPEDLGAGPIPPDGVAQRLLDPAAVPLLAHVDEVVDDHAAEVAEAELAGDLLGGAEVHLVGGPLGIVLDPEVPRVDVDGDQRLGLVDDDRAPFGQVDPPPLDLGDLVLDAVLVEQRHPL